MSAELREKAKAFPTGPGVYLWKSPRGEVLYVGKAQNLRARVLQYFGRPQEERKGDLVDESADVDFLGVSSVKEALILEQTLIKRHRPRYNVLLVDDKKYPYIAVTQEEWGRVVYTRDLSFKGDFFGPFPDAGNAKRVARMLNQAFRLRQCRTLPKRECLYYHLGQCSAPCIGAVTPQAYHEQVQATRAFLRGRGSDLAGKARAEMAQAALEHRFERAAELRDLAAAIDSVLERQAVDTGRGEDYDALGLAQRDARWCAVVLWIRGGAVVGKDSYFLNAPADARSPAVLLAFIEQLYTQAPRVPPALLLAVPVDEGQTLQSLLSDLHGRRLRFEVPERGERRRFVEMAERNAAQLLEHEFLVRERKGGQAVEALQAALALDDPPNVVECFDVSHHAGEHTVASLVVLREGAPLKSAYRRFRIRTASGGDDPAAMREAVLRRYSRVLSEEGADALPDLVVVDGGPTQLRAALDALRELGLDKMPLIGLAKRREEIHRLHLLHPLRLDPASPALHLLQRARDEAHRFAIGYQGVLKRRAFIRSELDDIPGVGPERRRRLLSTFGSVEGLATATVDQVAAVPGIPRPLAQRIIHALQARKTSSASTDG